MKKYWKFQIETYFTKRIRNHLCTWRRGCAEVPSSDFIAHSPRAPRRDVHFFSRRASSANGCLDFCCGSAITWRPAVAPPPSRDGLDGLLQPWLCEKKQLEKTKESEVQGSIYEAEPSVWTRIGCESSQSDLPDLYLDTASPRVPFAASAPHPGNISQS